VPIIAETIEEWDEPLLTCLEDIKLQLHIEPVMGFTLEFHFHEQAKQHFRNEILTKFYEIRIESNDDLLLYEGVAIVRSVGCEIDWTEASMNLTRNSITNEEQASFFHFFTSTSSIATGNTVDDMKIATDFQIGHYIRENLVPKAILFYTGEIFDDDYNFSDNASDEHSYSLTDETGNGEHL
jgi:nucleosome assembly protein 1-like 1